MRKLRTTKHFVCRIDLVLNIRLSTALGNDLLSNFPLSLTTWDRACFSVVLPQSGAGLAQGSKPNNAVQPGLAQSRRFIQQHNMIG